jgi:hypothetical protein
MKLKKQAIKRTLSFSELSYRESSTKPFQIRIVTHLPQRGVGGDEALQTFPLGCER